MQNFDNFINIFSKDLIKLDTFLNKKSQDDIKIDIAAAELFYKLLFMLLKRSKTKFVIDQNLWKELYYKSIYFYKYQNDINGIPIKLVTKHNQIIPFYMSQKIHDKKFTLVHFDTHSDEAPVKNSALLPDLYKKYLDTNNIKYLNQSQNIVWDIGAANSGILYSTGIRDVTWCLPSWIPDDEIQVNTF